MDDSTNTSPINGSTNGTVTETHQSGQPPPNDTMNRTTERTCTQKLTIPTLDKQDYTSANMWWRKFTQYIKMTNDLDLSTMTNSKEILPQYRDQLEAEIKDIFLWAIEQNAITEMTKTVREREPSSLPLHKLYSLFRLHFTPERNVHHSRADFFELKREEGESAADVWKRILTIERNCEFETITAAELLASKFLSVIGKSTGDYDLKKKIRKSDMSVEAITDALHEHMYEKLNDSPETEEEKKIRYLNKRKAKSFKEQTVNRSQNKILTLRPNNNRDKQNSQERSTVHHKLDQWRNNNRHIRKQESPLAEISANSRRRGNVEDRRTLTNFRN